MSLWTDIRDTLTSPFRAAFQAITAIPTIAIDTITGKNVFESIKRNITEITSPVAKSLIFTNPIVGLSQTESGRKVLESSAANKVTFGMTGNVAEAGIGISAMAEGQRLMTMDEILAGAKAIGKAGVATVGIAAASGAFTGTSIGAAAGAVGAAASTATALKDTVSGAMGPAGDVINAIGGDGDTAKDVVPSTQAAAVAALPTTTDTTINQLSGDVDMKPLYIAVACVIGMMLLGAKK